MRNLVVWSGGCDSTLVLHNLAKLSSKDSPVIAISVDWKEKLDSMKVLKEKEARNNYLTYAKQKGFHIKNYTVTLSSTLGIKASGYTQVCLWFCAIMPFIENGDKIYFGYHRGDGFWGCSSNIHYAFEQLSCIRSLKKVEIKYPLAADSKCEVLKKLFALKIPRKCFWWCESPVKKRNGIVMCGKCNPCITHKLALYERKIRK